MEQRTSSRSGTPPRTALERVEIAISHLLRTGVAVAMVLVVSGLVLSYVRHPSWLSDATQTPQLVGKHAAFPHTMHDVFDGVRGLDGPGLVLLGIIVLIATPVLRVAVSIVAFWLQRDRVFVIITLVVLLLLLTSFLLGKVEG